MLDLYVSEQIISKKDIQALIKFNKFVIYYF